MYKSINISRVVVSLAMIASMAAITTSSQAAESSVLKIATGPKGKGYSKMFQNIKDICGDKVPMVELNTEGGLDNLNVLSLKKAHVGIAQIDTITTMKAGNESIAAFQQVLAINNNYLNILVSSNGYKIPGEKKWGGLGSEKDTVAYISQFSQLRGKNVALVGSAKLLGQKLDKALGFGMKFVEVGSDAEAQDLVKKGIVHAMFTVAGVNSDAINKLAPANGLRLAGFDVPVSAPLVVKPVTYSNIGSYNVQALAIRNVIVSRPFKGPNAKLVADLKACIIQNLQNLNEGEYEPGWNEVKNYNQDLGIEQFPGK